MIGKITGTLTEVWGNLALIKLAGGLSFQVYITSQIINKYKINDRLDLYTYLQVREDALTLYGFLTKTEYDLFKLLISISGIGPKTGFSIISFTRVEDLYEAVKQNNSDYFTHIPGLGRKTALKIILELSQKLNQEFKLENLYLTDDDKTVIEALMSLGYKASEAKNFFSKVPKSLSIEDKIKYVLRLTTKTKK